ncbi:hypothetical protein BDN70DRAFT_874768 [Pholiota conissans]|uniref:TEA domain-containing protein n=1 Tax=Pholiota conissans TaxID=109636 RepID=A0A9P5Z7V4_9AGAR|nr:hypothetical protein BDN70DRAFT_874768 [Pholiota conissans]
MPYSHYPVQAISPTARTGRKTLKYKRSEPVWSVALEEALLRGLQEYRPSSARNPALLQRFPRRNKWISDYIFQQTGKTRTAKQVGSRLQQLRETCSDSEILGLIINKSFPSRQGSPRSSSSSAESSLPSSTASTPTSSTFPVLPLPLSIIPQQVEVSIALVLHELDLYYGSRTPCITLDLDECGLSEASHNASSFTRRAEIRSLDRMSECPLTIKFSATALQVRKKGPQPQYRCVSSVYRDDELVFTDAESNANLQLSFFDEKSQAVVYSTKLVPEFWGGMTCDPSEYFQYKISQHIYSTSAYGDEHLLFAITYHLESGSPIPSTWEALELPPSMMDTPVFPNCSTDITSGYDFTLFPADSSLEFSYPQYPGPAYDMQILPQNVYY